MTTAETDNGKPGDRYGIALFVAATAFYITVCASLLDHSLAWLLRIVPDDLFYYLQIARHLADSGVSTFDGIEVTNGYHPGWMAIATLCAKMAHDRQALMRLVIAVAFLFHFLGALALVSIHRHFLSAFWSWVGAALWLLNPIQLLLALQGLETALYVFGFLLVIAVYLRRLAPTSVEAPFAPSLGNLVLFGVCLALACYARTEALVFAICTVVFLAWNTLRAPRQGFAKLILNCGIPGLTCLICLLPWFVYSHSVTGHITQDSGVMKMIWRHDPQALNASVFDAVNFIRFVQNQYLGYTTYLSLLLQPPFAYMVEGLPLLCIAAGLMGVKKLPRAGDLIAICCWLFGFFGCTVAYYWFLTNAGQVMPWYVGPFTVMVWLAGYIGVALKALRGATTPAPRLQMRAALALLSFGALVCLRFGFNPPALYPWQADVYATQPRFEQSLPPEARIGCFNAGIPAYFSDRVVVNLDGLVNHTVVAYWKERRFSDYLRDQRIDYIIDEPESTSRGETFSSKPFRVKELARLPMQDWVSPDRYCWRVMQ